MAKRNRKERANSAIQGHMVSVIDQIAAFEQFREEVLPALQKAVAEGHSPSSIRKRYMAHMTARLVTEALTNADATKAIAAIKELSDREWGKATEHKEIAHKLGRLEEKELDAILLSEIEATPLDEPEEE
jgi:hypothetical protein